MSRGESYNLNSITERDIRGNNRLPNTEGNLNNSPEIITLCNNDSFSNKEISSGNSISEELIVKSINSCDNSIRNAPNTKNNNSKKRYIGNSQPEFSYESGVGDLNHPELTSNEVILVPISGLREKIIDNPGVSGHMEEANRHFVSKKQKTDSAPSTNLVDVRQIRNLASELSSKPRDFENSSISNDNLPPDGVATANSAETFDDQIGTVNLNSTVNPDTNPTGCRNSFSDFSSITNDINKNKGDELNLDISKNVTIEASLTSGIDLNNRYSTNNIVKENSIRQMLINNSSNIYIVNKDKSSVSRVINIDKLPIEERLGHLINLVKDDKPNGCNKFMREALNRIRHDYLKERNDSLNSQNKSLNEINNLNNKLGKFKLENKQKIDKKLSNLGNILNKIKGDLNVNNKSMASNNIAVRSVLKQSNSIKKELNNLKQVTLLDNSNSTIKTVNKLQNNTSLDSLCIIENINIDQYDDLLDKVTNLTNVNVNLKIDFINWNSDKNIVYIHCDNKLSCESLINLINESSNYRARAVMKHSRHYKIGPFCKEVRAEELVNSLCTTDLRFKNKSQAFHLASRMRADSGKVNFIFKIDGMIADIIDQNAKVHFELKAYYFKPFKLLTQCYNCSEFGHYEDKCKNSACCPKCGGKHSYKECSSKCTAKDKKDFICGNCCKEGRPNFSGHSSWDKSCPIRNKRLKALMFKTKHGPGIV